MSYCPCRCVVVPDVVRVVDLNLACRVLYKDLVHVIVAADEAWVERLVQLD